MHFEVLVEDQSGKRTLDILIPKIIKDQDTFNVIDYRGIGNIPPNLKSRTDVSKRILLDQLPRLLRGFGKTFTNYPINFPAVMIVVCDLDRRCLKKFRQELLRVLDSCNPKPKTRFCIAIEEGEAWLLGDIPAIKKAYPSAIEKVLNSYQNDSICGTWEVLADAVVNGGSNWLRSRGYPTIGQEKTTWAEMITPYMDITNNKSPSFCYFRDKIRELI